MAISKSTHENLLKASGVMEMGYGIIPKKVMRDKRLTVEAKAIYAYIASFAGSGNTAFPSVSLICDEIGMSNDRFYRHRKQLIELGYISVEQIRGGQGKTGHNIYTLISYQDTEKFREPQNKVPQNKVPDNKVPQNEGTNNNNSIINSSTNNKDKKERKKAKAFIPPTIDEIKSYIDEMGYGLDPEEFLDANEQTGWKMKNGQQVRDWKARVRTFERNRKKWTAERSRGEVSQSGVMEHTKEENELSFASPITFD